MNQIIGFVVNTISAWADLFNGRFALDKVPYLLAIVPLFLIKGILLKVLLLIFKGLYKLLFKRTKKKEKKVES